MNFDKLQEQWNKESNEVSLPKNLEKIKEAHNPIEKVRKNMKADLILQIISIIIIGFAPSIIKIEWDIEALSVFSVFYSLMLGFCLYYGLKFYRFYKESYNLNYDSRKNLMWFSYELRLFIELYRALTFILMFLGLALGLYLGMQFGDSYEVFLNSSKFTEHKYLKLIVTLLLILFFGIGFVIIFMEIYIKGFYGKYYKKIKDILNQLDEE